MQLGDILFYKAFHGNILDTIVETFEHKKDAYVHCAIAINDTQKVEAVLNGGIVKSLIGKPADSIYQIPLPPTDEKLQTAYTWLQSQIGHEYGSIDIVDAVLASLNRGLYLPDSNFDCSALCCQFLTLAGINLGDLSQKPHNVTPQELADRLGVK